MQIYARTRTRDTTRTHSPTDGSAEGAPVGGSVGADEGNTVGAADGSALGSTDGAGVVGADEGVPVGEDEGVPVGGVDGSSEGAAVGSVRNARAQVGTNNATTPASEPTLGTHRLAWRPRRRWRAQCTARRDPARSHAARASSVASTRRRRDWSDVLMLRRSVVVASNVSCVRAAASSAHARTRALPRAQTPRRAPISHLPSLGTRALRRRTPLARSGHGQTARNGVQPEAQHRQGQQSQPPQHLCVATDPIPAACRPGISECSRAREHGSALLVFGVLAQHSVFDGIDYELTTTHKRDRCRVYKCKLCTQNDPNRETRMPAHSTDA